MRTVTAENPASAQSIHIGMRSLGMTPECVDRGKPGVSWGP